MGKINTELSRIVKGIKTPVLVTDLDIVQYNYELVKASFDGIGIFYAIKSNNDREVIRRLNSLGCGFDVASISEIVLAMDCGVDPSKLIFSAPIKKEADVKGAYEIGVRYFTFDSYEELIKIDKVAKNSKLFLRLFVESEGSQCPMFNKFGVYLDEAASLLEICKQMGCDVIGITFHVGSQAMTIKSWRDALIRSAKVWNIGKGIGIEMDVINIGGGFPAKYAIGTPDIHEIMLAVKDTIREYYSDVKMVYAEPGRYLTNNSSVMIGTVIGKAKRGSTEWLYLDVGVYNGLFEVLEGFIYELTSSSQSGNELHYAVGGPTCDGLDVIRRDVLLPETNIGDKVYIHNAGAYSISMEKYNGLNFPDSYCY